MLAPIDCLVYLSGLITPGQCCGSWLSTKPPLMPLPLPSDEKGCLKMAGWKVEIQVLHMTSTDTAGWRPHSVASARGMKILGLYWLLWHHPSRDLGISLTASRVWKSRLLSVFACMIGGGAAVFSMVFDWSWEIIVKKFFVLLGGFFPGPLAIESNLFCLFELIGIFRLLGFFSSK